MRQKVPSDAEAVHKAKDLAASETIQRGNYDQAVGDDSPVMKMALEAQATAATDRAGREIDGLKARIDADPTQPGPYLQLAALHRRQGRTEDALKVLARRRRPDRQGLPTSGRDRRDGVGTVPQEPLADR